MGPGIPQGASPLARKPKHGGRNSTCCSHATVATISVARQPRSTLARVMRWTIDAMIRVLNHVAALTALAGLLAACAGGSSQWHDRLTLLPASRDRILGERLIDAQYVVAGRVEHVERASLYEQRGGGLMRALFRDEGPPAAHAAKIPPDSALVGRGP